MTNAIATITAKLISKIEWAMRDLELSYADAKALVAKSSIAGPAIWEAVDARFA